MSRPTIVNVLVLVGSESEKFTKAYMTPDKHDKTKMVPTGYNWDLFSEVKERLQSRYEFVITYTDMNQSNYGQWLDDVTNGKYDMAVGAFIKSSKRDSGVNYSNPTILDATSVVHVDQDNLLNDVRKITIKAVHLIAYITLIGIAMGVILYFGDPARASRYQKMNKMEFFMRSIVTGIASVFGEMGFLSENTSLKSIPGAILTVVMMIICFLLIMFAQAKITQKMLEISSTYNPGNVRKKKFAVFKGSSKKEQFEQYGAFVEEVEAKTTEDLVKHYMDNQGTIDGCVLPYASAYFFKETNPMLNISTGFGYFTSHWIFNKSKMQLTQDVNAAMLMMKEDGSLKSLCVSQLGGEWDVPVCSLF